MAKTSETIDSAVQSNFTKRRSELPDKTRIGLLLDIVASLIFTFTFAIGVMALFPTLAKLFAYIPYFVGWFGGTAVLTFWAIVRLGLRQSKGQVYWWFDFRWFQWILISFLLLRLFVR